MDQAFTRRSSYGPSSPTVGTRGARRRRQIIDAALVRFTERGFHATSVEDIAAAAETSRATLYQYFESKEAIFVELMNESGGALHGVTRRLGPLGPTSTGYANLHWWLSEWSKVFDRYSAMFIEWANVNTPEAPLRSRLVAFVDAHTARFATALATGGHDDTDTSTAAILVIAIANRFNYIRHVYRPGLTDEELLATLSTALQLYLFPSTPSEVLAPGPLTIDRSTDGVGPRPVPDLGPLAKLPPRSLITPPDILHGLTPQSTRTVRQLLDAASRVFAAKGYPAASIDQIITEAGLARGTFYRYLSSKLELITVLAHEAASEMCPLFEEFATFTESSDRGVVRDWLRRFLAVQRRYAGVMRAWTEGFPIDPVVLAPAADVVAAMGSAIRNTFGERRPYPLDRRAMGMLFAALLEHFPNEGVGSRYEPSDDGIIDAQIRFIERVLLVPGPTET